MRDVRDVDAHLPAAAVQRVDGEGVVVVLGVGRVDGEDEPTPQVHVLVAHVHTAPANGVRRSLHLVRELQRQLVAVDHCQNVDAGLPEPAQHLAHRACRAPALVSPVVHVHHHHVAVPGAHGGVGRDEDIPGDLPVFRHHEAVPVLRVVHPDDAGPGPLQDTDDPAFGPVPAPLPLHTDHGPVAVQRRAQMLGRDEHIGGIVVRDDEPGAAPDDLDPADHQVDSPGHGVAPLLGPVQDPLVLQPSQLVPELVVLHVGDAQAVRQLLRLQRTLGFVPQVVDDTIRRDWHGSLQSQGISRRAVQRRPTGLTSRSVRSRGPEPSVADASLVPLACRSRAVM